MGSDCIIAACFAGWLKLQSSASCCIWVGTNLPQQNNSMVRTHTHKQAQLCACESKRQSQSAVKIGGRMKTTSGQVWSSCIHRCLQISAWLFLIHITRLTNRIFIEDPYIIHRTRPNYWMTHRCTTAETEEEKRSVRSTDQILFCQRDFDRSSERTGSKIKPNINNSPKLEWNEHNISLNCSFLCLRG